MPPNLLLIGAPLAGANGHAAIGKGSMRDEYRQDTMLLWSLTGLDGRDWFVEGRSP